MRCSPGKNKSRRSSPRTARRRTCHSVAGSLKLLYVDAIFDEVLDPLAIIAAIAHHHTMPPCHHATTRPTAMLFGCRPSRCSARMCSSGTAGATRAAALSSARTTSSGSKASGKIRTRPLLRVSSQCCLSMLPSGVILATLANRYASRAGGGVHVASVMSHRSSRGGDWCQRNRT